MKKTFWKDLFKTITHTKVTFISILLFVMMGIMLFFGMDWSAKSLINSSNYFFDETNAYDIQLNVSPGYTNPEELLNIKDIDEYEGIYNYITEFKTSSNAFEANIISISERINTLYNIDGTIPTNPGEIALIRYWAEDNNFHIGDTITIKNEPVYIGEKRFSTNTFKVTAIVDSSAYMAKKTNIFGISPKKNIPVNATFFVDKSSFNSTINEATGFNTIYLKSNSLKGLDRFTNDYYKKIETIQEEVKNSPLLSGKKAIVLTIRDGMSHQNTQITSKVFDKVKYSLSGLFIVVGLLVSYFSISRMINETKTTIGIKKANGFKENEITIFYLLYVTISILIGSIIGVLGARFLVEPPIASFMPNAIVLPKTIYAFSIVGPLLFFAGELIIQLIIVFLSTRKIIKKNAINLIKNENQVLGKKRFYQKGILWNKLSLFKKTLINNFFTDKNRIFSMLVGIASCTSLLICALTIDQNINNSFDTQFSKVFSFQSIVYYDCDQPTENIKRTLDGKEFSYADVMFTYLTIKGENGKSVSAQTYIFNDDSFNNFVHLYDVDNNAIAFEDGVYLSCSYKEEFNLQEHTNIKLTNSSLESFEIETKGFFQHYLINNFIFMNSKTYEESLNGTYKSNALLVNLHGHDFNELLSIKTDPSVIVLYDIYGTGKVSFTTITSLFKVLNGVFLILSVLMALLVVLDLLVMLIDEKKTELITLMINGYSRKDAKRYIYSDTILLSIIGITFGILFGTLMSSLAISAFQNETMYFLSGFNPICCLIGVVASGLIILGVTLIALRKINKLNFYDLKKID